MPDSAILDQPISGRAAWTRADICEADYTVALDDAARTELLAAVRTLRQQPVPLLALRPDSFDLPHCRQAMAKVKAIVTEGPRFALLSRLPMEDISLEEAKKFTETLIKGDPNEGRAVKGAARQLLSSILPGGKN